MGVRRKKVWEPRWYLDFNGNWKALGRNALRLIPVGIYLIATSMGWGNNK
jgi:hypothetical protein